MRERERRHKERLITLRILTSLKRRSGFMTRTRERERERGRERKRERKRERAKRREPHNLNRYNLKKRLITLMILTSLKRRSGFMTRTSRSEEGERELVGEKETEIEEERKKEGEREREGERTRKKNR